jgi:voltage-gated potassium channel
MRWHNKRVGPILVLLLSYAVLLVVSFVAFINASYTQHFTNWDVVQLIAVLFYTCFLLFVQLPLFRNAYINLYRLGLLLVSPCLIALLARVDWTLSRIDPHNFSQVLSKWDSVYFTITTLATVGYGDITPVTQEARIWTTAQIVIGFAFIAIIIQKEMMSGRNRRKNRSKK